MSYEPKFPFLPGHAFTSSGRDTFDPKILQEEQSDSLLAAIDTLILCGDALARGDSSRSSVERWDDAVRQIKRVW